LYPKAIPVPTIELLGFINLVIFGKIFTLTFYASSSDSGLGSKGLAD